VPNFQLQTPVALIIFNRPDTTERVFKEIARAKPPKLLVVADGPRQSRPGEAARCDQTRGIIERVDWSCEVLTNFSDINLGCKSRVASGLDWVFEQVPEAIILEDDCLPHPSFFRFCQEMLERYRMDNRIGMISGDNFQFGKRTFQSSYYFSRFNHIWGWASWRRAWRYYDKDATQWPEFKDRGYLDSLVADSHVREYWMRVFQAVHEGKIDTWDYQWILATWINGMMSIMPNVNLVSNIGFGNEATHTRKVSIYGDMGVEEMQFPLRHPNVFQPDVQADRYTANRMFTASILRQLIHKATNFLITLQHQKHKG
jgi:hypothetical protein